MILSDCHFQCICTKVGLTVLSSEWLLCYYQETAAEGEEVSLHFESFLHENGSDDRTRSFLQGCGQLQTADGLGGRPHRQHLKKKALLCLHLQKPLQMLMQKSHDDRLKSVSEPAAETVQSAVQE